MSFHYRNPLKRKTPPVDDSSAEHNGATAVERPGEYETGRIDCPSCHKQVAFRDEETGEFSLKRWQQHWDAGQNQADSNRSPPARFTHQTSTAPQKLVAQNINSYRPGADDLFPAIMAHPPTKRRRAKRTEEERITYLDADPYVAKFEAYRVLCASCDKWIRLRPNSTYCSIPWDAHRKSCLSKKISNKNTYALDERNSLFSKDPDVRKFDAERVLCAVCDRWIAINSEDHLQAVQTWLNHRGDCAKRAAAVVGVAGPGPSSSGSPRPRDFRSNVPPPPSHMQRPGRLPHSRPSSPPHHDMDPYRGSQSEPIMYSPAAGIFPPGPAHESRRRNAEQRAATLRADTLIKHVEPNRVFCSLCEKWVQLRQDSSFCAYPWFQHRGKCLARYQRRAQKAAEIEDIKKRRTTNELAYFSGSDQGRSDEDDIPFNYRGLSASASPDSEGRSVSVGSRASHNERSGLEYATENADYVHSRTQLREEAENTEPDADSNVVDSNARPNGETRAESPSTSQTQSQPSTPGSRPSISMRHRPIAPRDTPILVQHPDSRAEMNVNEGQHRRTHSSHSLVPVPPRVLNQHHNTNGVSGMYRPLQRQREREYIGEYMDSRNNRLNAHSYGGKLSREKSDRAHQGHSQNRSHGPYGNGPLPSHTSGPASGRGVLADLDSHAGRKQFVSHSIAYLFQTTYDCSPCSSDELSISALVAYLNAAMPMDKHEDFDTAEVVRCVGALREKGRVLLEGDVVRKVRKE
ncbi:hypothetical protein F5879DRAFT_800541 [Lentinula edodes]|nr:hypothetical protein F5879DRAFT_800541 [Lentinula edodes]